MKNKNLLKTHIDNLVCLLLLQMAGRTLTLDTHDYDGYLPDYSALVIIDELELKQPPSFDKTLDDIEYLLPFMTLSFFKPTHEDYRSPSQIRDDVKQTIALFRRGKGHHLDRSDNIDSEDLLPRVWRFIMCYTLSGAEVFYEQLGLIHSSGSCLQGRSKRLYQLYIQHMTTPGDPIYEKCRIE